MFSSQEFAAALKKRRLEYGQSLRTIEALTGVQASSICRYELATAVPDVENYARLCRWLGVKMETFLR